MKLSLYSAYDSVAEIFNKPYTEVNDATACRAFSTSIQDNAHKNDYALYKLADYDDATGEITPLKVPVKLTTGFDLKTNDQEAGV